MFTTNICLGSENRGQCRGTGYAHGKHTILTGQDNPNGTNPTRDREFSVLYFKFGDEREKDTTYTVKFRTRNRKWSCDCLNYIYNRAPGMEQHDTCCKHIQGCIYFLNMPDRINPRLRHILETHITSND